jgi:hypothetical protein
MDLIDYIIFYDEKVGRIIRNEYIVFTRKKDSICEAKDLVDAKLLPTGRNILG